MKANQLIANAIRGFLIGTAEVIPGVSGGTVALITGVYDRIISSAAAFVRGFISLFRKGNAAEAGNSFRRVDLVLLIPLLLGMLTAILVMAKILEPLLVEFPVATKSVFAGMILVSIWIPFKMAGTWKAKDFVLGLMAVLVAVALTSLPVAAEASPSALVIVGSAALAICALVLPGVSGSFLLLAMGMYAPTIAAVNDRDLGYIAFFALGAILGLAGFVSLLQYLLTSRRKTTMVVMTGLMLGSLRALWPWQSDERAFQEISNPGIALLWFLVGAAIVLSVIALERRFSPKHQ